MELQSTSQMQDVGGVFTPMVSEIPIDVYNFFNVPPYSLESKELQVLKEISDWSFSDGSSLGDGMLKLRDIELKLGSAKLADGKIQKIHNYIKLARNIEDLRKRQEAI